MVDQSEQEQLMSAFRLIIPSLDAFEYKQFLQVVQRVRNIAKIIEFSMQHRTQNLNKWYLNVSEQPIEFDLSKHIESTKIILDQLVQKYVDLPYSDQIITGHKKLSNLINQFKKVVESADKEKSQIISQIQIEDAPQLAKLVSIPDSKKQFIQTQRPSKVDEKKDFERQVELREDLEEEIINFSLQMKKTAQNIQQKLLSDMTLLKKIEQKQDTNLTQVRSGSKRIDNFMKSKSLSCSTLFFMLLISISLTIFCLIFIKLF